MVLNMKAGRFMLDIPDWLDFSQRESIALINQAVQYLHLFSMAVLQGLTLIRILFYGSVILLTGVS